LNLLDMFTAVIKRSNKCSSFPLLHVQLLHKHFNYISLLERRFRGYSNLFGSSFFNSVLSAVNRMSLLLGVSVSLNEGGVSRL
jgi:predicted YcjX-like family ATPase